MSGDFATTLQTTTLFTEADTILAWDVANLARRSYNAYKELRANGQPSGHVFGSLKALSTVLQRDLGPGRRVLQVFCYEGRDAKAARRALLPSYKANRKYDDFNPIPEVVEVLKWVPGLHVSAPGHEADDGLVWVAETFRNKSVVVVSNDKDTWSLLPFQHVKVLRANAGGGRSYVKEEDVFKEYMAPAAKIPLAKALHGDSDNIKGVFRLQRKQTAPYLQDPAVVDPETFYAAMAAGRRPPMTQRTYDQVVAARQQVELNYRVILPIRGVRHEDLTMVYGHDRNRQAVLAQLDRWQCASLVKEVPLLFGNPTLVDQVLTAELEPVIVQE